MIGADFPKDLDINRIQCSSFATFRASIHIKWMELFSRNPKEFNPEDRPKLSRIRALSYFFNQKSRRYNSDRTSTPSKWKRFSSLFGNENISEKTKKIDEKLSHAKVDSQSSRDSLSNRFSMKISGLSSIRSLKKRSSLSFDIFQSYSENIGASFVFPSPLHKSKTETGSTRSAVAETVIGLSNSITPSRRLRHYVEDIEIQSHNSISTFTDAKVILSLDDVSIAALPTNDSPGNMTNASNMFTENVTLSPEVRCASEYSYCDVEDITLESSLNSNIESSISDTLIVATINAKIGNQNDEFNIKQTVSSSFDWSDNSSSDTLCSDSPKISSLSTDHTTTISDFMIVATINVKIDEQNDAFKVKPVVSLSLDYSEDAVIGEISSSFASTSLRSTNEFTGADISMVSLHPIPTVSVTAISDDRLRMTMTPIEHDTPIVSIASKFLTDWQLLHSHVNKALERVKYLEALLLSHGLSVPPVPASEKQAVSGHKLPLPLPLKLLENCTPLTSARMSPRVVKTFVNSEKFAKFMAMKNQRKKSVSKSPEQLEEEALTAQLLKNINQAKMRIMFLEQKFRNFICKG